jgi:hypothetical protein
MSAVVAAMLLSHDVYFTLKDDSPQARQQLVAGCEKYLSRHPGVVWFAAGTVADEFQRDVNDREFDVVLHVVFKDKASHDQYQVSADHVKFVEEFSGNWEKVRVFDSWLTTTSPASNDAGHRSGSRP